MDPIADLLVRIKNGLRRRAETVDIPHSGIKEGIVKILIAEGYLDKFEVLSRMQRKFIRLSLKYAAKKKPVITNLRRISRPGCRIYCDVQSIPWVQEGYGTAILSTPAGIVTDEQAREKRVGGEVLCYVW